MKAHEPGTTAGDKDILRRRMLAYRRAATPEEIDAASAAIADRLRSVPSFDRARIVHTYIGALPGEIRTDSLIAWCLENGRRVMVPVTDLRERRLRHVYLERLDDLRDTRWGGLEPANGVPADPRQADVIIVPGVAFDRAGGRLGMGGGFYDALLAAVSAPSIGLAHGSQIVGTVPREPNDRKVTLIVTPDEVIDCRTADR